MYRTGAERKIRKYLIDNNYIDAVIQLPPDLFFGTNIATCILVLKKSKKDSSVLFVDASLGFVHVGNKNKLKSEHQQKILDAYVARADIPHFTRLVPTSEIAERSYLLSVSSYVAKEDTRQAIDIVQLNKDVADIVTRQSRIRADLDMIIQELEADA